MTFSCLVCYVALDRTCEKESTNDAANWRSFAILSNIFCCSPGSLKREPEKKSFTLIRLAQICSRASRNRISITLLAWSLARDTKKEPLKSFDKKKKCPATVNVSYYADDYDNDKNFNSLS